MKSRHGSQSLRESGRFVQKEKNYERENQSGGRNPFVNQVVSFRGRMYASGCWDKSQSLRESGRFVQYHDTTIGRRWFLSQSLRESGRFVQGKNHYIAPSPNVSQSLRESGRFVLGVAGAHYTADK